jgi:cytochrome bd-type quinol oxidase subunit 2
VTVFELTVAGLFALLGVRSLVYWAKRPLDSRSVRDHLVYALWLTGRVGLWFAVAGIFAISASISAKDDVGFITQWDRYRWFILVPLGLAAIQVIAAQLLRRSPRD